MTIVLSRFTVDFYVIPLSGFDVILGMQWLSHLGARPMEFYPVTVFVLGAQPKDYLDWVARFAGVCSHATGSRR